MPKSNANTHAERGLLLVGHGSREPPGVAEFLAMEQLVVPMAGEQAVEACFLEFAEPTIGEGFRKLAERGVRRVVVVPVLLFSAGHAQRDIPAAVRVAAAEYPNIVVEQTDHLGCHRALLELSRCRYDEVIGSQTPVPAAQTALVMVGRGSHDKQATAEMFEFVRLRAQLTPVAESRACFVAMAEPRLDGVLDMLVKERLQRILDMLVKERLQRIVVQPHLLFGGVLVDRIGETVARYARQHPHIDWVLTRHLGPSPLVAQAILDRASAFTRG